MWLVVLTAVILMIAVVIRDRIRSSSENGNCFLKMVCTGTAKEAPLTEQEKHNILRQDFHPSKVASKWDVIVIGSGLSGLTIAKILAAYGRKVLVLEQHDCAGGSCHTFSLDRFEFDVGLHYVQKMRPGKELYKICSALTDSQVQWQQMDEPFDFAVIGDKRYGRIVGDHKAFCQQLKQWFPEESDKIDAYFKYIGSCLRNVAWFFRLKFMPKLITRFILSNIVIFGTRLFKCTNRTLQETMKEFGFSNELQAVCSYYGGNYGMPRNRASFWQHWIFLMESGYYPIGGTSMITSHIVRSIQKFGGKVLVKADVKEILFENGNAKGVVVKHGVSGCFIEAPMIVSTISLTRLFTDLIPQPIAIKSKMFEIIKKLNTVDCPKVACFQAYIGLRGSQQDLKLSSSNYFWYKTNDAFEIDNYLRMSLQEALDYGCPPTVFISFPSAKDPAWNDRHPDVSTCQLISITNPEWFEHFKDSTKKKSQKRINKDEYLRLKNTIGEMMVDQLIKMFPDVANKIVFTEFSTSLTQQYFMQNSFGEIYALAHDVDRFSMTYWSELRCKSGLPGLYLSGQDVLFCGVSSAFHNGLLIAGVILGRDLYKDLHQAYSLQLAEANKLK